ncbi:unnamed protein product, partial [Mesorhabditis belari]|uniref:UDP-N-acetylglucosamine diphosphorylase n=1 Tax=Mesorhabditis belari TaxID=2138241 RepID=A0AAF3FDT2_9BILA
MLTRAELEQRVGEQVHVLRFWDELSEEERSSLSQQIEGINVNDCRSAFNDSVNVHLPQLDNITPIPDERYIVSSELSSNERSRLFNLGLESISRGELCVLVLAGGQASRLGSSMPKGTIPLGFNSEIVEGDSLLSIQAAKIHRLEELSQKAFPGTTGKIHWAVMTSSGTTKDTLAHLEEIVPLNGLSIDNVTIFSQANIPAFDQSGNFWLSKKGEICTAPNGNGGIFSALSPHLPMLREKGVKYIQTYCVDNILCRVGDPAMLGMVIAKGSDCAAKTIEKVSGELVGSIIFEDGKPRVAEYSELGGLEALARNDGKLLYRAGSIAIHYFTMDFLESFCTSTFHLPYHRASKKIPYIDASGQLIQPTEPNGIKLEQFIFDVFPLSKNFFAWEVEREDEFSPLKNAETAGVNCISTCLRDLSLQSKKWLQAAGANFGDEKLVFVAASQSYAGEGLESWGKKRTGRSIYG